ncbi:hypothetical protein [Brevibacterium samyangense]|uniref:Secreted protein n=1 Tax=Brevibacterium samyangense TaxID=366888 RepID=A0ABP5EUH6_9MICO
MDLGVMVVVGIGLAVTVAIAIAIVLAVALPGLRAEGRNIPGELQLFRLPPEWTGHANEVHGFFGHDDGTSHLATREQAAVTAMQEHSYVLRPQPRRHAAPALLTFRPRTRHWKVPGTGTGFRTALTLLFG